MHTVWMRAVEYKISSYLVQQDFSKDIRLLTSNELLMFQKRLLGNMSQTQGSRKHLNRTM